jgi:hypothetical protein
MAAPLGVVSIVEGIGFAASFFHGSGAPGETLDMCFRVGDACSVAEPDLSCLEVELSCTYAHHRR